MPPTSTRMLDPRHEPVRVVDHITLHAMTGQKHDMTLCTMTRVQREDGTFDEVPVVTCRLQFDSNLARAIVYCLSQHLANQEQRPETTN